MDSLLVYSRLLSERSKAGSGRRGETPAAARPITQDANSESDAPNLLVGGPVAVVRVEDVLLATVCVHVVLGDQVDRLDVAARLRAGQCAVHLVDHLPAGKGQGLRHRGRLGLPGA